MDLIILRDLATNPSNRVTDDEKPLRRGDHDRNNEPTRITDPGTHRHSRNLTLSFPPSVSGNPENDMRQTGIIHVFAECEARLPVCVRTRTGRKREPMTGFITLLIVALLPSCTKSEETGGTALRVAALYGDVATVQVLVDVEADVEARDETGATALHVAASKGDVATVLALVEAGADVEARDETGATALHVAASKGDVATVLALVEAGADVEARDETGATALHVAAFLGKVATVQALVEAGADVEAKTKRGKTPSDFAENEEIIRLLERQ